MYRWCPGQYNTIYYKLYTTTPSLYHTHSSLPCPRLLSATPTPSLPRPLLLSAMPTPLCHAHSLSTTPTPLYHTYSFPLQQEELLSMLRNLLTKSDCGRELGQMIWERGSFLLFLIRAPSMPVRLISIKVIGQNTV